VIIAAQLMLFFLQIMIYELLTVPM